MWNESIKSKLLQLIEEKGIKGEELSQAIGKEKSWFAQFKIRTQKRIDLDNDVAPILDYLQINQKKFMREIIREQ